MKYKRLTTEELKELENEFVNFLSSAQITADDWEKMKNNEKDKAEELIDVFSDMVHEKSMQKIEYLEHRSEKTLNLFHCQEDKITLVGLQVREDCSMPISFNNPLTDLTEEAIKNINLFKQEKKYTDERGVEIFDLIQKGCLITDEKLFNLLVGMTKK